MSRHFDEVYFKEGGNYLLDAADWRPINGFPDYFICEEGYVAHNGRILKKHKGDREGHLNVRLNRDGKTTEKYIHRLLAEEFIPNPDNLPIVRHLDDDPTNNDLNNLAWGTQRDNHYDAVSNGTYKPFTDEARQKMVEVCRTPVIAVNIESGEEILFNSQREAEEYTGAKRGNISKVVTGVRRSAGGYKFRYADKEVDK